MSLPDLPEDVLLLIGDCVALADAVALFSVCRRMRAHLGQPAFWEGRWRELADELDVALDDWTALERAAPQLSAELRVKHVYAAPPLYEVWLKYNPNISRDEAVKAIAVATNVSWSSALLTALPIGHQLSPTRGQGVIFTGRRTACETVLSKLIRSNQTLQAEVRPKPFVWATTDEERQCSIQ